MNLEIIYELLQEVNSVGIKKVILESEGFDIRVRGIDEKEFIYLYDVYESPEEVFKGTMTIQSVKTLLDRFNLFDKLSDVKADIEFMPDELNISAINMKKGRRKVSYTFAPPKSVKAPMMNDGVEFDIISTIHFPKERSTDLINAIKAMGAANKEENSIDFYSDDGYTYVKLSDDISDTFVDCLGEDSATDDWKGTWHTDSFKTLLNESVRYRGEANINITDRRVMFIQVNNLNFILSEVS